MIVNTRQMGESTGVFEGLEVENSQFAGMKTIFYTRFSALRDKRHLALVTDDCIPRYDHVFIALINPNFFANAPLAIFWVKVLEAVEYFIACNKLVTFELDTVQARLPQVTQLREKYPHQFCAMITVEVPLLDIGGFAIKLAPTNVFTKGPFETGVKTLPCQSFDAGTTRWSEYALDVEKWM